ncbi:MAG TPA: RDD family protein [Gammaproteobacteria bacterium]
MLLDTTYDIATPEGVELRLPLAGLAPRALAWLVDAGIKTGVLLFASMFLRVLGVFGLGVYFVVTFVLLWFYNVLFEVLGHGATPGKRSFGIAVVNRNGTPVGWSASIIRNLIRAVDVLPGCYAFGCISVLISGRFQRLGDLAAGTVVVHRPRASATPPRPRADDVDPLPVVVPLSREEQQAIVDFGERFGRLNVERAEELAAVLRPVFSDVNAARLRAYAGWLAGRDRRS